MPKTDHVQILLKGAEYWNKWRARNLDIKPQLSGANLSEARLSEANLSEARLIGADLSGADLSEARLSEARLSRAVLRGAYLSGADLIEADLSEAWLSEARLTAAVLRGADLRRADLSRAGLSGANLSEARLSEARLSEARLSGAVLRGADLSRADLTGADLTGTELTAADLSGANLSGAIFSSSKTSDTIFASVDLRDVKGLGEIKHHGPSEISISTIYLSKGTIPFSFLRGAGVPEIFINYMHSLVGTAYEYYSCFISYSSKDQAFAERLHADLQNKGVRCWFAPHDAKSGQKLHEQIDQAIRMHEKLLLILSPDSTKSEWVKEEIRNAAHRQKREKKKIFFPVSLMPYEKLRRWKFWDGDLAKDLASEIRQYLIPDFSTWEDNKSYQKEFAKLLRDLQPEKSKA